VSYTTDAYTTFIRSLHDGETVLVDEEPVAVSFDDSGILFGHRQWREGSTMCGYTTLRVPSGVPDVPVAVIPDGVRLTSIKQTGDTLTLEGQAESNARVLFG